MAVIPNQIRATDPWSENRYTDHLNLRSRIITGGNNIILRNNSFSLGINAEDNKVTIGPGICVIDDVFIHVYEEFEMDPTDTNYYFQDSSPISDGILLIYFFYRYHRSLPPSSLSCGFKNIDKVPMNLGNQKTTIFLGYAKLEEGIIIEVGRGPIEVNESYVYTPVSEIPCLRIDLNGGVICRESPEGEFIWIDDWIYI